MNRMKLTKEQKERLLDMCKAFYPQYDEYTFWGDGEYVGMYHTDRYGQEILEDNISIHWFEFCTNYLLSKFVQVYAADNLANYLHNAIYYQYNIDQKDRQTKLHPVDYLYQMFQDSKMRTTPSLENSTEVTESIH